MDTEVILHLLRHADCERTTGVPAGAAKVVNQMPLRWLRDGLCARGRKAGHPFWYVRATSHHSNALLHKVDWAASQDTVLQNTPPDPGQAQLIVPGRDGHLDLQPPTMRTLGKVAQRAHTDHALTHRGHTPLRTAHATAYVHARDLTATATNRRALRARDGHTPPQRRLHVVKERLSGVAVLPQPCLLCGGPEETLVHMHMGCTHSRLLWPHYRQAVHEAARHLPPGDKALWVASWHSAGATWTEVFCSGLVPQDAEAQLGAIARYDPQGGTSVDDFLHHMLRLGDFAWELRNHRLEQLLREPLSAAARAHRWLTAAEGNHPPPPPRPNKDFVASLRVVNGTLECPPQEGPHPYQDLPGGFPKHLQEALFQPCIPRRGDQHRPTPTKRPTTPGGAPPNTHRRSKQRTPYGSHQRTPTSHRKPHGEWRAHLHGENGPHPQRKPQGTLPHGAPPRPHRQATTPAATRATSQAPEEDKGTATATRTWDRNPQRTRDQGTGPQGGQPHGPSRG